MAVSRFLSVTTGRYVNDINQPHNMPLASLFDIAVVQDYMEEHFDVDILQIEGVLISSFFLLSIGLDRKRLLLFTQSLKTFSLVRERQTLLLY